MSCPNPDTCRQGRNCTCRRIALEAELEHFKTRIAELESKLSDEWVSVEDITKEGWYFNYAEDEFVKVEMNEFYTYTSLSPRYGVDDPSIATGKGKELHCNGLLHRPDWGTLFYGPITLPNPPADKDPRQEMLDELSTEDWIEPN